MPNPFRLPMAGRSLRNLASAPATRRYPAQVRAPFVGARGTIELDLDTCVFCGLCVRRCPAVALTCSREEQWFAIEQLSCISCGVCVDVCNKNSLTLTTERPAVHAGLGVEPGARPGHRVWRKAAEPVEDATPAREEPDATTVQKPGKAAVAA